LSSVPLSVPSNSAYKMKIPLDNISEPQFELSVDGEQWKRVANLDCFGPDDQVYTLDAESSKIVFGDGVSGRIPLTGSVIRASYSYGVGAEGNLGGGPSVTLTWASKSFRKNEVIGAIIESKVDGTIFRTSRESELPHRWKWGVMLCRNIKRWALHLTCRFS